MDIYSVFKFLHVLTAIAWVGGGLTLLAHSIIASRASGDMEQLKTPDIMNVLGKTWFVPISLLTVVTGAVTTTLGGLWLEPWVLIGLLGFASTFFTGLLLLEPVGRRIGENLQVGQIDSGLAAGKDLLRIAKFDYTVMLVVIADMVFKPQLADLWMIAIFAAVIAVGAVAFLMKGKLPQRATA